MWKIIRSVKWIKRDKQRTYSDRESDRLQLPWRASTFVDPAGKLEVHRTGERQRESVRIVRNPLTRGPFGPTETTHERVERGRGTTSLIRGTWHSITLPLELCAGVYLSSILSNPPKTLVRAAIKRYESVVKIGVDGATLDLPPIPIYFFLSLYPSKFYGRNIVAQYLLIFKRLVHHRRKTFQTCDNFHR